MFTTYVHNYSGEDGHLIAIEIEFSTPPHLPPRPLPPLLPPVGATLHVPPPHRPPDSRPARSSPPAYAPHTNLLPSLPSLITLTHLVLPIPFILPPLLSLLNFLDHHPPPRPPPPPRPLRPLPLRPLHPRAPRLLRLETPSPLLPRQPIPRDISHVIISADDLLRELHHGQAILGADVLAPEIDHVLEEHHAGLHGAEGGERGPVIGAGGGGEEEEEHLQRLDVRVFEGLVHDLDDPLGVHDGGGVLAVAHAAAERDAEGFALQHLHVLEGARVHVGDEVGGEAGRALDAEEAQVHVVVFAVGVDVVGPGGGGEEAPVGLGMGDGAEGDAGVEEEGEGVAAGAGAGDGRRVCFGGGKEDVREGWGEGEVRLGLRRVGTAAFWDGWAVLASFGNNDSVLRAGLGLGFVKLRGFRSNC